VSSALIGAIAETPAESFTLESKLIKVTLVNNEDEMRSHIVNNRDPLAALSKLIEACSRTAEMVDREGVSKAKTDDGAIPEFRRVRCRYCSTSLLMSDGRAFCGDAAMNYLNTLGADYRPIFITDEKQTYESLEKLIRSGAKTFYSSHGPAFDRSRVEKIINDFAVSQK
jgi:hypothetical protein